MDNAFHPLVPPKPRFSPGKLRNGTVVCLCLWASASLSAAPSPTPDPSAAAASAYRQASESFNREDYRGALDLLDHAPEAGKPGEQADVWNLRGAIYLHQRHYDKARAAFARAVEKDPGLWAARFNLAEVNFRQGKYAESSKEFEELMGRTSRWTHSDEHGFLQYKLLLTQMLAGKEKPAQAYIDEHRGDRAPSLTYFYLNAAVEHHRGHSKQAEAWLAQADAHYTPANEQVFAESFRSLNWDMERSERLIAAARRHDGSSTTPANVAVVELLAPGQTPAALPAESPAKNLAATALPPAATPPAKPAFRTTAPPAPATSPGDLGVAQMPPAADGSNDLPDNGPVSTATQPPAADADAAPADPRAVYATPIVLGKPTGSSSKPKATPAASPSAAASATPAATAASATPTPAASATPSAPANPDFTAKYEKAYIQFLQQNYAGARKLLDEADAIQANQPTSVSLRTQIFKHFYEAAYAAYKQHADYNGALAQLDEADATQSNQPDASNLRGLTFSKLKDYEHAEAAFKRAITADPQFWAARFNYAELPFNYRNYTAARSRFEELSAGTDPARQPREVELTQFKIFLTLLLEGKVDMARSFMGHLSFTGKTPARYFCQAALEFYAGSDDKAKVEIENANKDFQTQPKLVDIFKESFYRIGWLNDPGNPVSGPPPTAASSPATALADASPTAAPVETPAVAVTTPPATMTAAPTPAVAVVTPSPTVSAQPTEAEGTPVPALATTDSPAPEPTPAAVRRAKPSKAENLIRTLFLGIVAINTALMWIWFTAAALARRPRRPLPIKRSPLYADRPEADEPDEVETPR